jgi:2-polyprenyl-6-methoxyphenol hydroxylase-like FAD-dependent oxidoreductase
MIAIAGRGIAALTCAQRLAEAGIEVCVDGPPRQGGPVVLIGDHTLGLLAEVFHHAAIQQVGHPVSRRQVHWRQTTPASVAVSARALALDTLTAVLETQLVASVRFQDATPLDGLQPLHWRLDATGRRASVAHTIAGVDSTSFGTRHIIAAVVSLDPEGSDCTVIECLQDGWLFLCPTASERGILQLMWPGLPHEPERTMQDVLNRSTHIAHRVDSKSLREVVCFAAAPRILTTLGSDRWLAVGETAFSVDPLCGDGVGSALHSAMLASATITTASDHEDISVLLRHYHLRHRRSFAMHLKHVYDYYQPLLQHAGWVAELAKTRQFLHSKTAMQLLHTTSFTHQLRGLRLEPIA